jgi:hypothetical protein
MVPWVHRGNRRPRFWQNSGFETDRAVRTLRTVKGKTVSLWLFILVFALSRIPGVLSAGLANFSAAYALAFCAGVYGSGRAAWWMPLGAMFLTDLGLNLYYWLHLNVPVWELKVLKYQLFNYAAYAAIIALGKRFKPESSFAGLLGGGILGALLFYFITNTVSWLFNPFGNPEYTRTLFGWLTALITGTRGWPETWQFLVNSLLSGGLFTGLFVGAMKLGAATESPRDKRAGAPAEDPEADADPEEAKA